MTRRKGFHEQPLAKLDGKQAAVSTKREDFAIEITGGDSNVVKRSLKGQRQLADSGQIKRKRGN